MTAPADGDVKPGSNSAFCTLGSTRPLRIRARILGLGILLVFTGIAIASAGGDTFQVGAAAFNRQSFSRAASIFLPLARKGDARAQTYLGFMYANGRGVPQDFAVAARWYQGAAQHGAPTAQYLLGLMYDKGQGVPQDDVTAYVWMNLAAAHAEPKRREFWTRMREAIAGKLTLDELAQAQRRAVDWGTGRFY